MNQKNNTMEYSIFQNHEAGRFEAVSEGKIIGLVDYYITEGGKTMVVPHTEVNSEYEGQGIASALTKELLEYAKQQGLSVSPICPYTKVYIERHAEYHDLL